MSLKRVTGSGPTLVSNMTLSTIDLTTLPPDTLDDNYEIYQVYLRSLVEEAQNRNPVVKTSGRMPLTQSEYNGVHVRMCMGGKCPIGNLFSDAFRWISGADIVGRVSDENNIARKRTYSETVANYVTPRVAPQIAIAPHV